MNGRSTSGRPPGRQPGGADSAGRTVKLEIGAVAHGGHCVARMDGRVVFVRHALPGELVLAEITEDRGGSFCRANAVRVLRASPDRVRPPCPLARPGGCGGCDWQHVRPQAQRELKATVVAEQLWRLAGIESDVRVEELPGGALDWRTRMELVADDDGRPGLRAHRSHTVIPLEDCPIAAPGVLDDALSESRPAGAHLRATRDSAGRNHLRQLREVRGRGHAEQLRGGTASEYAAGRWWQVDAHGFWQVHPHAPDVLAAVVAEWARVPQGGRAWDLYAGVGLFAGVLAEQAGPRGGVLAVESGRSAVEHGRRNLADLAQVRWLRSGVLDALRGLSEQPDVVVLDPPRKGARAAVVAEIARARPRRVIHVACDPAALARDVACFVEHGYRLERLRAFDAFPMTQHIECVALLTAEPEERSGESATP